MKSDVKFAFRLFVAGNGPNSAQAVANLKAICAAHLGSHPSIEVVDVFLDPKRAVEDGIFMTPTLIKVSPVPLQRIVGTLSGTQAVLDALGLEPLQA